MKWLDRLVEKKCREVLEHEIKTKEAENHSNKVYAINTVSAVREDEINLREALKISVLGARGGTVMQIHRYNEKIGENNSHTYVIGEEEPFAERIAQIISMEMIAR